MSSSRIIYLILLALIDAYQCLNNWTKSNGSYGEDIWQSTSDFIPVQSQSFGKIRIGHEMSAEFDFVFSKRTRNPRNNTKENFFRVGYESLYYDDCRGQKSSYPALWLSDALQTSKTDTGLLQVAVSTLGPLCGNAEELTDYHNITINVTHHILISINDTSYTIDISGGSKPAYTKTFDRTPLDDQIGDTVPVWWMSDKNSGTSFNVGGGIFSNIVITSRYFPTTEPTTDPTNEPSQSTDDPTSNPTNEPTIEPTKNPTIEPTIDPTKDPTVEPTINPTKQPSQPVTSQTTTTNVDTSQTFSTTDESIIIADTETTAGDNQKIEPTEGDEIISGIPNVLFYIIVAGVFVCCCCCLMWIFLLCQCQKEKNEPQEEDEETKTKSKEEFESKQQTPTDSKTSSGESYPDTTKSKNKTAAKAAPEPIKKAQAIKLQKGDETPATAIGGIDSDGIDEYEDGGDYDHVEYEDVEAVDGREWNAYEDEYYSQTHTVTRPTTHGLNISMDPGRKRKVILSTPKDVDPDIDGYEVEMQRKKKKDTESSIDTDASSASTPSGLPQHPQGNNTSLQFEEGYSWIALTLLQIASEKGDVYLQNFKAKGFSEDRLFEVTRNDLRSLIPDKMVRSEFQKLLDLWKVDQQYD